MQVPDVMLVEVSSTILLANDVRIEPEPCSAVGYIGHFVPRFPPLPL